MISDDSESQSEPEHAQERESLHRQRTDAYEPAGWEFSLLSHCKKREEL